MSWQERDRVSLRKEFVLQAVKEEANVSELCKRYKISRKTGYKWLKRYQQGGTEMLQDISRRPKASPFKIPEAMVEKILNVREKHPYWGARKIKAVLERQGGNAIPAKSVIHKILKHKGLIELEEATNNQFIRFEHKAPNHLWQMDFKGHFKYEKGRCHPLTILDDHSRFSLDLTACLNEKSETVKPIIIETFRRYGLPERMNFDNGNPWGSVFKDVRYTSFSKWLIRLGIRVSYSRPRHPQTNGKDERFHRTLKLELLERHYFRDLAQIQRSFDNWRDIYNLERPHEGIGMQVPADRYHPSYRTYPEVLPPIEYSEDYLIRKADSRGRISLQNKQIFVGIPFANEALGIRHCANLDEIEIYFAHQKLGKIDMQMTTKNTITNLYSGRVSVL